MSYFLRIEGMNLGQFVYDTNDLATIRGGSLLLLEAMDIVEQIVDDNTEAKSSLSIDEQIKDLQENLLKINSLSDSKKQKKKKKDVIRQQIKQLKVKNKDSRSEADDKENGEDERVFANTITKGASWGLFDLGDLSFAEASAVKGKVVNLFNQDKSYQHATFMIDICKQEASSYQVVRDRLQTLNRWQQLQTPSFSIVNEAKQICQIDNLTPANHTDYNKNCEKIFISDSIKSRRDYGREEKKQAGFYFKRNAIKGNETLKLTKDLEELASKPPMYASNLKGKVAFIYIDGNKFGAKQKASKNEVEQKSFDQKTRSGRDKLLRKFIGSIKKQEDWLIDEKLRLETLLWGGDEIIWVVPAWHGWWVLNQFYKLAKKHIYLENEALFHGSSIIFCHHNAPIHRIDDLARRLADNYSKKADFKQRDMIAYQVLKSFDHVGNDLEQYRNDRIKGLTQNINDLLIDAHDMDSVEKSIKSLKENEFPRRKIYQMIQAYREQDHQKADKLYDKLITKNPNKEQQIYQDQLEELQKIFAMDKDNSAQIHWLHLMELWDFIGLNKPNDSKHSEEGESP